MLVLQDRFEGIRPFLVHRHGHMRIPIHGDRDRRVPQEIGDDLRMHPLAQEQGSGALPRMTAERERVAMRPSSPAVRPGSGGWELVAPLERNTLPCHALGVHGWLGPRLNHIAHHDWARGNTSLGKPGSSLRRPFNIVGIPSG